VENRTILAIVMGVIAFSIALLFDWISIKKVKHVKLFAALSTVGLHGFSLYLAIWSVERFSLPSGLFILGWIMLPLFSLLLVYSLLLEVPAGKTYYKTGGSNRLTVTGSYALTRHPELLWYVLVLIALIFIFSSKVLLIEAPMWAIWKLVCVIVQDKLLFPEMFAEYQQYQKETPMIIPNRKSVRAFFSTLKLIRVRS
jgi:protein-S-isoprenylcysteine O-methyltransferase Ste14